MFVSVKQEGIFMDQAYHLYVISFTAGSESGLAMVAAQDERSAFKILQNGGSRYSEGYALTECRNIGMTTSCHYGILMESFVNAREAYDAIVQVVNRIAKGEKGDKGDKGDVGPLLFDQVNVLVDENTGTPSAVVEIVGTAMNIAFGGLKGETGKTGTSSTRIDQTIISEEDGGRNEFTIYMDDGSSKAISFRNGKRGISSATVSVDSLPGTPRAYCSIDEEGNLDIQFYGLKGVQGNPGVVDTTMVVVDELPQSASAETAGIIYLIYNEDTDEYDRYYTVVDGGTYTFAQIGDTAVNLEDYVRKDSEVWLTQEEFDAIQVKDITKTYNIYEEEEDVTPISDEGDSSGSDGESE